MKAQYQIRILNWSLQGYLMEQLFNLHSQKSLYYIEELLFVFELPTMAELQSLEGLQHQLCL
jgi:hypothetical protein